GLAYGAGFMLATAALHLSGLAMGAGIGRFGDSYGQAWVRRAGAAVSVAGLGLVLGAL
ncbi:MAG: urease accessory protein, partial [Azorhizobium sp. 35-67-5]